MNDKIITIAAIIGVIFIMYVLYSYYQQIMFDGENSGELAPDQEEIYKYQASLDFQLPAKQYALA